LLRAACGDVPLTKIGVFHAGEPNVEVFDISRQIKVFSKQGWRHF
jgi:hypothetical protein